MSFYKNEINVNLKGTSSGVRQSNNSLSPSVGEALVMFKVENDVFEQEFRKKCGIKSKQVKKR